MKIQDYVNKEKVLEILIKYRVKMAHAKHKDHLITGITANKNVIEKFHKKPEEGMAKEILEMMPARRKWVKLDAKARKKNTDSLKRNTKSLRITIKQQVTRGGNHEWLDKQNAFIEKLIAEVLDGSYRISKSVVRPYLKENKKGNIVYRPIAVYGLKDRIVISLIAKYLTDVFDWTFKETNCAYAFRSVLGEQKAITHHDAIIRMKNYIESKKGDAIYVAETDIRKFFDCVNHSKAMQSFNRHIRLTKEQKGIEVDSISENIFSQYLSSYSFKNDVYSHNTNKEWFKSIGYKAGEFKWEEKSLKGNFYPEGIPDTIGVPQGGAISCLISNLLLDQVDKKLMHNVNFKDDKDFLYIRYCDDMIIMHTNYDKCKEALTVYEQGLTECNLLYHEYKGDVSEFKYDYKVYKAKSKPVYKLALKNSETYPTVPWVAFVGYQIRYDGTVRVRRNSLSKEKIKQKAERMRIMKSLDLLKKPHASIRNLKKEVDNVAYRLEQRYISMSVGRIKLHELEGKKPQGLCWTNGFKQLNKNGIAKNQMKELDRSRRANMIKLLKHLTYLGGRKVKIPEDDKLPDMDMSIVNGHPFSYHYYWHNK